MYYNIIACTTRRSRTTMNACHLLDYNFFFYQYFLLTPRVKGCDMYTAQYKRLRKSENFCIYTYNNNYYDENIHRPRPTAAADTQAM